LESATSYKPQQELVSTSLAVHSYSSEFLKYKCQGMKINIIIVTTKKEEEKKKQS
jgi:hypothetical protein